MRDKATNRRDGKTVIIIGLSILATLLVVAAWLWPRTPSQPTSDEGRQVAEQFLNEIRAGRASQAWESTTAEFKSALGREKFLTQVKKHPFLKKPVNFVELKSVVVQQAGRTEALFRSTKGPSTVRLLAGSENGKWCIDRMTVDE